MRLGNVYMYICMASCRIFSRRLELRSDAGRSSAWLERLVWDQEAEGSNPFAPTVFRFREAIERLEDAAAFGASINPFANSVLKNALNGRAPDQILRDWRSGS
jgi:hypothetical protein